MRPTTRIYASGAYLTGTGRNVYAEEPDFPGCDNRAIRLIAPYAAVALMLAAVSTVAAGQDFPARALRTSHRRETAALAS